MHERKHSRLVFAWLSPSPPPVSYCRACVHAELLDQLLYYPVPWRCDQWRRLVAASSRCSTGEDVDVGRACQQCPAMKQKKKTTRYRERAAIVSCCDLVAFAPSWLLCVLQTLRAQRGHDSLYPAVGSAGAW
jgi:hypothetical protein